MSQEDLRVQRTRRLLRAAFIQLVTELGYEQVTVREITKQAQVGYKTFYRHYDGKEMLLKAILEDLIQDFQETLGRTTQPGTARETTIAALQFTQTNADLFRALAQSPAAERLLEPLLNGAREMAASFLSSNMSVPDELAVYHVASSIDALIKWWLKQDFPYSVEDMATYIERLVIEPVAHWHEPAARN